MALFLTTSPVASRDTFNSISKQWKIVSAIAVAFLVVCQVLNSPYIATQLSPSYQLYEQPQGLPPRPPRRYGNPNLTEIPRHPHAGAKDEFGHFGYVHDPTILRNLWSPVSNYSFFVVPPDEIPDLCAPLGEGPEATGYNSSLARGVFEKIIIATESSVPEPFSSIKLFCAIYTHAGGNNQSNAVRQTWAKRCDGFMAASTETNHDAAAVHLPHFGKNEGNYYGIWQKVRSMLAYIYDNFIEDYDYFFLCGDDTYLIVENLKAWLMSSKANETTLFAAGAWTLGLYPPEWGDWAYLGGGSGYVLGRQTVKAIVERVLPVCNSHWDVSCEDIMMSICMQKYLNVQFPNTRDEKDADRFIQYDPVTRALNPNDYMNGQGVMLNARYQWATMHGLDSVSTSAISFHLVKPPVKMRRYERIFYRMRNKEIEQRDCGTYRKQHGNHS